MRLPLLFAGRYLFARKSHNVINIISGISVAGMATGTAALIITLSVFNGFNRLVKETLSDIEPDILVSPATGKAFLPDSAAMAWLGTQPQVESICNVLEESVFLAYQGRQGLARSKGVDSTYERTSPLRGHIREGQFSLHRGDLPQAVVGNALALSMGIHPRFVAPMELYYPTRTGKISLSDPMHAVRSCKVSPSGLFTINVNYDGELIVVPMEVMRELLEYEREVSGVEIRTAAGTSEKETARLVRDLSARLGDGFGVKDRFHQNEALYKMMRYEKLAIYLILIFIIIVIAFNIFSSLSMLIIEKEGDIRTLRSLGATDRLVRRIFVLEGWFISLLGLAIGLVAGIGFVLLQQRFGFIKMPGNYLISAYPVVLKATDVLWTVLGVAGIGYLIALLPSFRHKTQTI